MRYLLNQKQMKACDTAAIEKFGMNSLVLMERAALSVRDVVFDKFPNCSKVLVLCGSGNNGGDGFACARLLLIDGIRAEVLFIGKHSSMTTQTKTEEEIFKNYGGTILPDESPIRGYDLIVDALFGIGLSREVIGKYADIIRAVNISGIPILAVDIPSGIDADDGSVRGTAIKADVTVTFAFEKLGQALYPGAGYCGEIIVKDVGITDAPLRKQFASGPQACSVTENTHLDDKCPSDTPPDLDEPVYTLEASDLPSVLPPRNATANKGTYGRLLLIAGVENMAGAALIAGRAAYRTGCGLVCVFSHDKNRPIIQMSLPEALYAPWWSDIGPWLNWATAVAIGPGLGRTYASLQILEYVLRNWNGPLVMDADALNLAASHPKLNVINPAGAIITPHPGEMARLLNADYLTSSVTAEEISLHPIAIARDYSRKHHCITVLKGARTVVTDGHDTMLNTAGNEGMATGGSGDALTGIIGSLLAQGAPYLDAARAGVILHSFAGDVAASSIGTRSLKAGDIARFLPQVLREF